MHNLENKLELLKGNYWEHFNLAKSWALVYPVDHWKMKRLYEEIDKLQSEIHTLEKIKGK